MQLARHCTAVILACLAAANLSAQAPATQPRTAEGEAEFLVIIGRP
jgi:hypothetical protein